LLHVFVLPVHYGQKLVNNGIKVESVLVLEQKQDKIATGKLHQTNENDETNAGLVE